MPGSGGGIRNAENLTLASSHVSGNAATLYGGGIYNYSHNGVSYMTLNGTAVSNNFASYGGGVSGRTASLTVTGSTVNANQATGSGGGIQNVSSILTITNSTISGNNGGGEGGGISARYGDVNVTSSTISGNSASDGAGHLDQPSERNFHRQHHQRQHGR